MDDYTKKIIHYMNNPKFQGKIKNSTHKLSLKSSYCGDWNDIYLEIENKIIKNISYENSGCALNISTLEIVCEFLLNKNINLLENLDENLIRNELDFPNSKKHCIDLTFECLKTFNN